jgi:hypothetical protein
MSTARPDLDLLDGDAHDPSVHHLAHKIMLTTNHSAAAARASFVPVFPGRRPD